MLDALDEFEPISFILFVLLNEDSEYIAMTTTYNELVQSIYRDLLYRRVTKVFPDEYTGFPVFELEVL